MVTVQHKHVVPGTGRHNSTPDAIRMIRTEPTYPVTPPSKKNNAPGRGRCLVPENPYLRYWMMDVEGQTFAFSPGYR